VVCSHHTSTMEAIIHNTVYKLRTNKGITQGELAEAVGVTRQTIISIEKGNYTPSLLLAIKIAHFFEVNVEKVFSITYE
jgi:putative transcriptional regulator